MCFKVSAECVPGGIVLPSEQPVLWCDSSGHWRGDRPSAACICLPGHIHFQNRCVEKGPRCYACVAARSIQDCNRRTTVEQCRPGYVCGMENVVGGALNKGCMKERDCVGNAKVCPACIA